MPDTTIDELTLADEASPWAALGFTVEADVVQLGSVALRLAGTAAGRGILGWSLRGLRSDALDGLPSAISERPQRKPAPVHPNGAIAIEHVVAMTPDLERSMNVLRDAGLDLRRVREEPTPAGAPRQAFFRLGGVILELVQVPEDALARAGGPEGPARFWGLALLVEDLDRAAAAMGGHAGEIRPAVQPGRRIATLRRSAGLSVPLALMSFDEREEQK